MNDDVRFEAVTLMVAKLHLDPGDVLWINVPKTLSMKNVEDLKKCLENHFPGRKVVLAQDGIVPMVVGP